MSSSFRKSLKVTDLNTVYTLYGGLRLFGGYYFSQNLYNGKSPEEFITVCDNALSARWNDIKTAKG